MMLTCDLVDRVVISSSTLRVPGCALDRVFSPWFKAIKGPAGSSGVNLLAGVGAHLDDSKCV